jgi:hypothetical protein
VFVPQDTAAALLEPAEPRDGASWAQSATGGFAAATQAFNQVSLLLRSSGLLPLAVVDVLADDARLRGAAADAP